MLRCVHALCPSRREACQLCARQRHYRGWCSDRNRPTAMRRRQWLPLTSLGNLSYSYYQDLMDYTFSLFLDCRMYSDVRIERARIVHVRFLSPCCTNGPASTTNRFLQSCACPQRVSNDFFGSSPILVVPPS